MIKLDYSLQSPEERRQLVEKILEETPNPNSTYLETLADYLVLCMEKQEKKERKLLTDNRLVTVNKREISFEGIVSQLENGEDGIYNMINQEPDKNIIFQPKIMITQRDLDDIPCLKQLHDTIKTWETKIKQTEGRSTFIMKRALIEMRKEQYLIKISYRKPIVPNQVYHSSHNLSFDEDYYFNDDGYVVPEGISFINPKIVSIILCNYSHLREDAYGRFDSDLWYFMEAFDDIATRALEDYPIYESIVTHKVDGCQNKIIQQFLLEEFGSTYSVEYISSLWRNKIPKLIASQAEDDFLDCYFLNEAKGKYKRCSRCGQIKLAHPKYFSKNKTSRDGFYSICKKCRNTRMRKNK